MRRREIRRQFDAIVDFAGVEKFLDTPVKRYSSGMYVRLAFAVAAHLNPEILIVDEVLAVGDAEFQKKCLGKMQDVAQSGRTVLFVSHNMGTLRALCSRGILMQKGSIRLEGDVETVVESYSARQGAQDTAQLMRPNQHGLFVRECELRNAGGKAADIFQFHAPLRLRVLFGARESVEKAGITFAFVNKKQEVVSCICPVAETTGWITLRDHTFFEVDIPEMQLFPGSYTLDIVVHVEGDTREYLALHSVAAFSVEPATLPGASLPYKQHHGVFRLTHQLRCGVGTRDAV